MNDIEVSSIDLVEGGNVFKQGHYLTLGYVPRDENGNAVDLSGKNITVALWERDGIAFESSATYSGGVLRFTLNETVPAGNYQIEFTATSSTDTKYRKKFPTNYNSGRISVQQSADDAGNLGISVYTVAQIKSEQQAAQVAYQEVINPKITTLTKRVDDGVGAFTEDTEVIDARMGKANLRQFNEGLTADLNQREINVRQPPFNAKGDGVVDDTESIQSAINSLSAGGTVFLPDGLYKTTNTIIIPRKVKVRGAGTNGTVIQYYGENSAVKIEYNQYNSSLESLQVERKGNTKAATIGILMEANLFCSLSSVRVLDFETGFKIDGKDLWAASNVFYNLFALRCTIGIHITADTGKQSNHNVFFGGYIVGQLPQVVGSKSIFIERGDSNRFYGTAVEDYDTGYHFTAVDSGGNSATNPRAERCTINYLIDKNTTNTVLIDPFGAHNIQDNSQTSLILSNTPTFRADNLRWGNTQFIKFRDSGGVVKNTIGVSAEDNVIYKTPSFYNTKRHEFEVANSANVHMKELIIKSEEVEVRRYLKHGVVTTLPLADSTHRKRQIFLEGGSSVADKLCVCVKKADGSYGWFDEISNSFV